MALEEFKPDYSRIILRRTQRLMHLKAHPAEWDVLRDHYAKMEAQSCIDWINHWCITFDPRRKPPEPKLMPMILFKRQNEFVEFIIEMLATGEHGLVEKSRDMGATWLCCAIAVWLWLFFPGSTIGFGSLLAHNIDDRGNPKSIFLKIRQIISFLPRFMLPIGFQEKVHAPLMKVLHPTDTATIIGEGGVNVGRGGRTSIYFKDEALTLSSKVLTINGWKLMGELSMQDKVISSNGLPQDITHINDCGEFETYKVLLNDGTEIQCSPNHLWTLNEVIGKRKTVTIKTTELFDRYKYISRDKKQTQFRFRLPLINPVEFNKVELPLHPYVIGALIGDGGMSGVPKHSPKFTSIDSEIVDYFSACLPDYCTIKPDGKISYRLGDIRGRMGWKHKSRIRQAIVDIGLAGKCSYDKYIPDIYKYSSINQRIELLQGLMDTDGSAGKTGGSAAYYTSSRKLADDVRFICESLGGYGTLKIKKDKRGFRDQYVVFVILPAHIKPFRLQRKLDIYGKRKNSVERSIVSVTKTGKIEPVRCITVNSSDGLYLTNGCVPTHNSAHYEQPELIEASLGDNSDVQIDISSVNGSGNVFYKKRMAGEVWYPGCTIEKGLTRVFIFDWRENPLKSQEWYDRRYKKAAREGLLHILAQEVDRNYNASIDRIIIPPDWVNAAVDAHLALDIKIEGFRKAGQDIADDGGDKNALAITQGILLYYADHWGGDAGDAAKHAIPICKENGVTEINYDSIGVGAGFKAEIKTMRENGTLPQRLVVVPWNAGAGVIDPEEYIVPDDPETPTNEDMYENLKAQSWFRMRARFYKTYRAVRFGEEYDHSELISIDSTLPRINEVKAQFSQAQYKSSKSGKTMVDKKPDGTNSPNLADSIIMAYNSVREISILDVL